MGILDQYTNPLGIYGQSTVANPNISNTVAPYDPSLWDKFFGYRDANGIAHNGMGGLALGAASGLMNGYMAMQNYGLAKDQFNFQKNAFNKNWAAQKSTTNAAMSDRQAARVASNPTAYQSVGDYMTQYGIK